MRTLEWMRSFALDCRLEYSLKFRGNRLDWENPRLEGQRGLMMVTRCCFVLTRWVARFKRRGSLIFVKYDTAS